MNEQEKLENRITDAILAYVSSERAALSYHDRWQQESALDALDKLARDAKNIAQYALTAYYGETLF